VRVLSDGEPRNISEITEEVKRMRGKSSRRIVAERLNAMCNMGILERVSGKGKSLSIEAGSSRGGSVEGIP
jgi:DNA-binding HxlR family transcriptional regulator